MFRIIPVVKTSGGRTKDAGGYRRRRERVLADADGGEIESALCV